MHCRARKSIQDEVREKLYNGSTTVHIVQEICHGTKLENNDEPLLSNFSSNAAEFDKLCDQDENTEILKPELFNEIEEENTGKNIATNFRDPSFEVGLGR